MTRAHTIMNFINAVFEDKRLTAVLVMGWLVIVLGTFWELGVMETQFVSFGPSENTFFMGICLNSWSRWGMVASFTFVSTAVNDFVGDALVPFITNAIQDHKTMYLPYSKFTCWAITQALSIYGCTMSIFSIYLLLSQLDFMLLRLAADSMVNLYTTYRFMKGKKVNAEAYYQSQFPHAGCDEDDCDHHDGKPPPPGTQPGGPPLSLPSLSLPSQSLSLPQQSPQGACPAPRRTLYQRRHNLGTSGDGSDDDGGAAMRSRHHFSLSMDPPLNHADSLNPMEHLNPDVRGHKQRRCPQKYRKWDVAAQRYRITRRKVLRIVSERTGNGSGGGDTDELSDASEVPPEGDAGCGGARQSGSLALSPRTQETLFPTYVTTRKYPSSSSGMSRTKKASSTMRRGGRLQRAAAVSNAARQFIRTATNFAMFRGRDQRRSPVDEDDERLALKSHAQAAVAAAAGCMPSVDDINAMRERRMRETGMDMLAPVAAVLERDMEREAAAQFKETAAEEKASSEKEAPQQQCLVDISDPQPSPAACVEYESESPSRLVEYGATDVGAGNGEEEVPRLERCTAGLGGERGGGGGNVAMQVDSLC